MTSGSLEALEATKRLASDSSACPPWCDRQHDRTGDDRGINHGCVIIGPLAHRCVEAYLRATETVDDPGVLGPVSLAIFSTETAAEGPGWFLEIAVEGQLGDVQDAVARAMTLMSSLRVASSAAMRRRPEVARTVDLTGARDRTLVSVAAS